MGEVYRAKDTRLDRIVAVKVLPSELASHPEMKQRFEREARSISTLSHPHVCTLYDIGHQDGVGCPSLPKENEFLYTFLSPISSRLSPGLPAQRSGQSITVLSV